MRSLLPLTIFVFSTSAIPLGFNNLFSLVRRQPTRWDLVMPDENAIEQAVEDLGIDDIDVNQHHGGGGAGSTWETAG